MPTVVLSINMMCIIFIVAKSSFLCSLPTLPFRLPAPKGVRRGPRSLQCCAAGRGAIRLVNTQPHTFPKP